MKTVRPTGDHHILDDEFQLVISTGSGNTEFAEVHISVMNHGTVVSQGWYKVRDLEAAIWQRPPVKPTPIRVQEPHPVVEVLGDNGEVLGSFEEQEVGR